jgi:hypothetical protein
MKLKTCLLSIVALLIFSTAMAQDKIYKKNGDMISGKVKEISGRTISYKKADNPDGPVYTINKADLDRIEYSNGTEDNFDDEDNDRRRPPMPPNRMKENKNVHYRNNILSISPMQITEQGVGVGIAYERVLDKSGILSFYFPAIVAFNGNDLNSSSTGPGGTNYNNYHDYNTYYLMPGLKFYPTGSKGKVRYAVGPNVVAAFGQRYVNNVLLNNSGTIIGQDIGYKDHFSLGMIINNSLNINPTARLHLGLEMGIGITYLDQTEGKNTGETEGFFQFGFKIGYRF